MSEKTIVIIGCGFFGISTANRLARSTNYKIILVTISQHAYFLISSIRVPVQNKPEGTFVPLKEIVESRVEILQDEVTNFTDEYVQFKNNPDISFDALIVATGAKWPDPIGSNLLFKDNYKEYFDKKHQELNDAKHIVLVGGGFNNCELLGEMIHHYKEKLQNGEKKITMLHSRELLLADDGHHCEAMRSKVTNFVKGSGVVDLHLSSRGKPLVSNPNKLVINGDPENTVEGDLIIYGTGTIPAVPPNKIKGLCDNKGAIRVNEAFQVKAVPKGNVFSIGDVTDFEYRGLMVRRPWLKAIEQNVKLVVQNPDIPESKLYKADRSKGHVSSVISLGPEHGFGQLCLPLIGTISSPSWLAVLSKSKTLVVPQAKRLFNS